jgi:hypothetical protein
VCCSADQSADVCAHLHHCRERRQRRSRDQHPSRPVHPADGGRRAARAHPHPPGPGPHPPHTAGLPESSGCHTDSPAAPAAVQAGTRHRQPGTGWHSAVCSPAPSILCCQGQEQEERKHYATQVLMMISMTFPKWCVISINSCRMETTLKGENICLVV